MMNEISSRLTEKFQRKLRSTSRSKVVSATEILSLDNSRHPAVCSHEPAGYCTGCGRPRKRSRILVKRQWRGNKSLTCHTPFVIISIRYIIQIYLVELLLC